MDNFLAHMKAHSLARVSRLLQPDQLAGLRARCFYRGRPEALDRTRPGIIAEIKPVSPSDGVLTKGPMSIADCVKRAKAYEANGAVAISMLTEPSAFGGSLAVLTAVSTAVRIPVMRKDFLVHPIQIDEAAVAGASGVLIIARLLNDETLLAMVQRAQALSLFILMEAFDEVDLERIRNLPMDASNLLVGVNTRDLATLRVRPHALQQLSYHLPHGCVAVAESGLHTGEDILRATAAGYTFHLVGTALMTASDPNALLRELVSAAQPKEAA